MRNLPMVLLVTLLGCMDGRPKYTVVYSQAAQPETLGAIQKILASGVDDARDIFVEEKHGMYNIGVAYHVVPRSAGERPVSRDIEIHVEGRKVWVAVHETDPGPHDPIARDPRIFDQEALARRIERAMGSQP